MSANIQYQYFLTSGMSHPSSTWPRKRRALLRNSCPKSPFATTIYSHAHSHTRWASTSVQSLQRPMLFRKIRTKRTLLISTCILHLHFSVAPQSASSWLGKRHRSLLQTRGTTHLILFAISSASNLWPSLSAISRQNKPPRGSGSCRTFII